MNPITDELKNEILNKMTQPEPELPAALSDERLERLSRLLQRTRRDIPTLFPSFGTWTGTASFPMVF